MALCCIAFVLRPAPSSGCDAFVIRGTGTTDGSIIMGALYEWTSLNESYPILHVDRQAYPAGATVQLSDRTIPQVTQTWAYTYSYARYKGSSLPLVAQAINECSVAIGSTSLYSNLPVSEYRSKGVDFTDCNRIVAERATTAAQGVDIIGSFIQNYRYTSSPQDNDGGQAWVVADPNEAWIVECYGGYWFARRITETFFNCTNAPTITTTWDKGNDTAAINYAISRGWCTSRSNFNWQSFGYPLSGSLNRYNAIRNYFTPRLGKVTPQVVKAMFRTSGVGNFDHIALSWATLVAHLRAGGPSMIRGKAWIAVRAPWYQKLFIPLYAWDGGSIPAVLGLPGLEYWSTSAGTLSSAQCQSYEHWADTVASCMETDVTSSLNQGNTAAALLRLTHYLTLVGEQALGMYNGVVLPPPCPSTEVMLPIMSFETARASDRQYVFDMMGRRMAPGAAVNGAGSNRIHIRVNAGGRNCRTVISLQ